MGRQICYDIRTGMCYIWKKYLIYLFVLVLFAYSMCVSSQGREVSFTWLDCVSGFFRGMYEAAMLERTQSFRIPAEWFVFHMGYVFLNVSYPCHDYSERGYQFLLRSGSRKLWWVSKYMWTVGNAILYCALFYLLTFGLVMLMGGTPVWEESDIWGFQLGNMSGWKLRGILFVMPVLTAVSLSVLELCVSFLWNEMAALLVSVAVLVSSAYWKNPFLIGNYTMLYRYRFEEQALTKQLLCGVVLSGILIIVAGIVGYECFKRQEFMKRGDFHGARG